MLKWLKIRRSPQFLPGHFQSLWRELDIIQHIEHEVIDRHGVPGRIRFRCPLFALCAVKNGLYGRSRFGTRSVQQRDSICKILNCSAAVVALDFWSRMAFVVYLKYKRHGRTLRQVVCSARATCLPM
jgi:hypothetical protein